MSTSTSAGVRLIKSFVKEQDIINNFNLLSKKYKDEHILLARVNSVFFPLVLLLVGVSILITVYVGGTLVLKGLITIGEVTEFIIYFQSFSALKDIIERLMKFNSCGRIFALYFPKA